MEHNGCYTNLNIHQRVNAKSWIVGITCGFIKQPMQHCLGWKNLPPKLAENLDEPFTKEATLLKKNWLLRIYR